ncbi:MAG: hypothetical protein VX777_05135 [Chlamydiota bacterium]|nr:hypothetical protein [Chlamydiota bacterium]
MTTSILNTPYFSQEYLNAKEAGASLDDISPYSAPVNAFVDRTKVLAGQVLQPRYVTQGFGRKVRIIGSVPIQKYNLFPVYSDEQRAKIGKVKRVVFAVLNAMYIVAGGFIWIKVRQMFEVRSNACKEVQTADVIINRIHEWQKETSDEVTSRALDQHEAICRARKNIFERMRRKTTIDVVIVVSVVAALALGVLGAVLTVLSIAPLGTMASLGVVIAGSLTGAFVVKWIFDKPDKGHKKDAQIILKASDELEKYRP